MILLNRNRNNTHNQKLIMHNQKYILGIYNETNDSIQYYNKFHANGKRKENLFSFS